MQETIPPFRRITPKDVWTEPGASLEAPIRSAGCLFMDNLAAAIRRNGSKPAVFYARLFGVPALSFNHTVFTLSGLAAKEWIEGFVNLDAHWILLNTLKTVNELGKLLGFGKGNGFARQFRKLNGESPEEFRKSHRVVHTRMVSSIEIL